MDRWIRISVTLALAVFIGACGSSSTPVPGGGAAASQAAAPSAAPTEAIGPTDTGAAGASPGATGTVQGSIVSSGAYATTWTWHSPNTVNPGEVVLTSDKNSFGDLQVDTDGAITFTTGDAKIVAGSPFLGQGGKQTVKQIGGIPTVCGIAVDSDVTGTDGTVLHLKGSLTISGTVTGDVSAITC